MGKDKFKDSRIQRFKNSKIQEFKDSRIQKLKWCCMLFYVFQIVRKKKLGKERKKPHPNPPPKGGSRKNLPLRGGMRGAFIPAEVDSPIAQLVRALH